jgi:acetyl esterase/lipase
MKVLISPLFLLFMIGTRAQQPVISLYPGPAPGSENWNWKEKEGRDHQFNTRMVYNVTQPTLTVFLPDSAVANGTGVLICPGGAFQILAIDHEGFDVARWLNNKGIAAFVLKYRLNQSLTDDPVKEILVKLSNPDKFNEDIKPIVAMDMADGQAAIHYIRNHASEFHLSPRKIGIMGFSAGGTVAAGIGFNDSLEDRPDFLAPIYPYVGSFPRTSIPRNAPPLFTAAAADDQLGLDKHSVKLYTDWTNSRHIAELHLYSKGGHGFGMRKQNLPCDAWIQRFYEWLGQQGF